MLLSSAAVSARPPLPRCLARSRVGPPAAAACPQCPSNSSQFHGFREVLRLRCSRVRSSLRDSSVSE